MQSKIVFKNNILKLLLKSKNHSGLRCLQFLSIVVFFEFISFAFVEKYEFLVKRTAEITDDLGAAENVEAVPLSAGVLQLRTRIFISVFDVAMMDYREQSFQLKYGYIYFTKYILKFCGILGPVAEKSMTGTSNKRKFQDASGGDRKDTKALESVNVKVCCLERKEILCFRVLTFLIDLFLQVLKVCDELKQEASKVSQFP